MRKLQTDKDRLLDIGKEKRDQEIQRKEDKTT